MHVVIIGNGVTGITAAITLRKLSANARITIISSESKHFYSRTALMYLYTGHMEYRHIKPYEDWFWPENNIELIQNEVTNINFLVKEVNLLNGPALAYDKLLLATGSVSRMPDIPGQELKGVQGFYNLTDLQQIENNTAAIKRAILVGGGLIGIELAEMLHSRRIPVTFLVREARYWGNILPPEESEMIQSHVREHQIDLRLNTTVAQIIGNEAGNVTGIITSTGEQIFGEFIGIAIGVTPAINFLRNTKLKLNRGILVNEMLQTNIPDVFAAGDCAELSLNENETVVEQLWYTGRMQGETVAHSILGTTKSYNRGVWYNSAKFFHIEYQTYGVVPAQLPPNEKTVFWRHPNQYKCIRINYDAESGAVLGFNLLGIRYRHAVCENWINSKKTIDFVLKHLKEANFDPEFYRRYEKELINSFNQQLPVEKG